MLTLNRIKDSDNVVYGKDEDLIPTLSKYLQISVLGEKIRKFREAPVKEGVILRGARRTSALMFIPDLYFDDDLVMGGNVWLYLGDMQPAYCIYVPWTDNRE